MISVKIIGLDKLGSGLQKMQRELQNLKPAFESISDLLTQEYRANFDAKGGVLRSPWAARKHSYPWPLLQKTGTMKRAWDKEAKKTKLTVWNTVSYAQYHHFGMPPQTGKRKLVGFSPPITLGIKTRIEKRIREVIASSFSS